MLIQTCENPYGQESDRSDCFLNARLGTSPTILKIDYYLGHLRREPPPPAPVGLLVS